MQQLPCGRHCAKHFTFIGSFPLHNNPKKKTTIITPISQVIKLRLGEVKGLIQDYTSIAQQKNTGIPRTVIPESVPQQDSGLLHTLLAGEDSPRLAAAPRQPRLSAWWFQLPGRETCSHRGGTCRCGARHLGAPLLQALFQNPFTRPWFGWFGANPSLALISVAQLSCHGDGAHRAKPGKRCW